MLWCWPQAEAVRKNGGHYIKDLTGNGNGALKVPDHYTFLGNCPPTPPLSQHFALSEK